MTEPLFLRPPHLRVFLGTALVLALREPIARRLWRPGSDRPVDRGSFRLLWAATGLGVAVAMGAALAGVGRIGAPAPAFWLGIATMLAGFSVRLSAMLALGRLFSHRVAVKDDHEVVDRGPYRVVRHPAYTGATLTYLGIGLATGTWVGVVATTAGALVGFGHRVRIEERALRETLAGYEAYVERTPYRLVPGIW